MREYEVVFIVHPELDESALNEVVEKVKTWITESGGEVSKVDAWGKKKLAYLIRKQSEGIYYSFTAKMAPQFSAQLERNLRFLEPVLRFLIVTKPA
jgi:small subunit ribosomal protein S6